MEDVKITGSYVVKPAEVTPTEVVPLSEFDHVAGATWVPTIYFYKPDEAQLKDRKPFIATLRDSLSRALVHYYQLAGRLRRLEGGRMQLSCDAAGMELIEAELASGASCSQVLAAEMGELVSDTSKFQYLLPAVDVKRVVEEVALLHVQVTHFGCGGFSLGVMMSHAVADGCSAFYFITDWARIARGEAVETCPFHDRTILRAGEPPKQLSLAVGSKQPDLPIRQPSTSEGPPKETDRVILPLTRAQVDKLKKAANADHDPAGGRRAYSRFEVLAAHIWRSTCKARGHESEELRALGIAIDARFRLPSFPKKYFGNTAFVVAARGQAGELISMPIGFTCQRIRQTIEGVTEEYIWSEIEFYKRIDDFSICQELRALRSTEGPYVNPDPGVISWLSMPLFGLDFGWGGEVHLSSCTPNVNGLAFIYPTRENEGDVVVSISLQVDHVDKFKKHFYDDIM